MHALLYSGSDVIDLTLSVGGSNLGVGGSLLGSALDLLGGFGGVVFQLLVGLGSAVAVASGKPRNANAYWLMGSEFCFQIGISLKPGERDL